MKNAGMFCTLFIDYLKTKTFVDDAASGRMATLAQALKAYSLNDSSDPWEAFLKQAVSYLEFVPPAGEHEPGVFPLFEDWEYRNCLSVLIAVPGREALDSPEVGRFYPGKLIRELRGRSLTWGILTNGRLWRLYSTKSSRPFEDYVELDLASALEQGDESEYALFERFFHKDSFVPSDDGKKELPVCRLDEDRRESEAVLDEMVKKPFLAQVDEVLQYICNGFIYDTRKSGEEYSEGERREIFESAVKLIYRALFLFYAEARRLLPSDPDKADLYRRHSINALCQEARRFRWGGRHDTDQYDLWQHLQGLTAAVNDGDPEYGIMGYNGGLFDDGEERFLGNHRLRNDFLGRALYLLAYVEPYDNDRKREYEIPYEDLEVRHLGELYENILEYTVILADADRIRRRTKKGVEIMLASGQRRQSGDTFIKKGEVYFGESALERKQTGSYYTPEPLVRFLNEKSIAVPLFERFESRYRDRFNAFKREALEGLDAGTRRGAAESAAELIGRFAEEELLSYTVCDPAMGSGHFLVDVANQMTGVVMSLLAEVPSVEAMASTISNSPNVWRRRITRSCIYGVDLNPLAVNLAKLSLWLNCFASEHKLTFLDHHLRCGNSLIGIRDVKDLRRIPKRKKDTKKDEGGTLFDLDDLSAGLTDAAGRVAGIARMDEDDTDRQRAALQGAEEQLSLTRPIADLYTAYLMNPRIAYDEYRQLFTTLAAGEDVSSSFNLELPQTYQAVKELAQRHDYFHWPFEFPEVFGPDGAGGFNATVGNPPWDMSSANPQDFFVTYDPTFRRLDRNRSLKRIKELCRSSEIDAKWRAFQENYTQQNAYFSEPTAYPHAPTGRNNLYQYFLHRSFDLARADGLMALVVPSGLYTDKGSTPLRQLIFDHSHLEFIYCFENKKAIFNIHRSFKFILIGLQKGGPTDRFKCSFMEHEPDRLADIEKGALVLDVANLRKFAPDTLTVMEFSSQREVDITERLFADHLLLGHQSKYDWNADFSIEFMTNTDAHRFEPLRDGLIPVFAGRNFVQYDHLYMPPERGIAESHLESVYADSGSPWTQYRLVFRDVASNTNERTSIATIVPPPNAFVETARIIYVRSPGTRTNTAPDYSDLELLLAVLNSVTCDFVMRQMVTAHVSQHIISRVPTIRKIHPTWIRDSLITRVSRMLSTDAHFRSIWKETWNDQFADAAFWYPAESAIDCYGPAHEQEIRKRLKDEAASLSPEWGPHCGVHDRLPDRRDTGDRAQLRAEIDAYVAHLYSLSRDDFAYILDTFPVLKNKEMKAFGEFMSKRKCLEEYDRIGRVLANE